MTTTSTANRFAHETDHGTIHLPKFKFLNFGMLRKIRKEPEAEQMFLLLELNTDKKTLAIIDQLNMDEIEGLYEAWQKDSGVDAGESGASSDS